MMTTAFDVRVEILFGLRVAQDRYPQFKKFLEYYDLGLPYAQGVWQKHITLTPKGKEIINDTWYGLMSMLDKPDNGFESFDDFISKIV